MKVNILKGNKTIAKEAKLCDTLLTRTLGLMMSKPKAAVLKASKDSLTATSIHTFLMRFPLDVIWMNSKLEVVDIKRNVKPYRALIAPKGKAMYVLEIPATRNLEVSIGDRLKIA